MAALVVANEQRTTMMLLVRFSHIFRWWEPSQSLNSIDPDVYWPNCFQNPLELVFEVLEFLDSDDNLSETDLEELREIIATGMIPEEEQIKKQEKEAETVYPVFVVGLEPTLDKKDLVNHFSSVANPVQARVLMQKRGGVSTAVAFVDFGTKSEADRIIKKFNNTKFQNKSITVRHADNSKKGKEEVVTQSVYVRNLPFSVKEVKLEKLFEKFGDVKGIRLPVFEDTQKHKGYAFIDFSDAKSAKKALALDRTEVDGRKILVELAKKEHQEQERSEEPKQKKPFPNKRSFKH